MKIDKNHFKYHIESFLIYFYFYNKDRPIREGDYMEIQEFSNNLYKILKDYFTVYALSDKGEGFTIPEENKKKVK